VSDVTSGLWICETGTLIQFRNTKLPPRIPRNLKENIKRDLRKLQCRLQALWKVPDCVQLWALVIMVLNLLGMTPFSHTWLTHGAGSEESSLCCRVCGPVQGESLRCQWSRQRNLRHT
jgi:hypothetical protein